MLNLFFGFLFISLSTLSVSAEETAKTSASPSPKSGESQNPQMQGPQATIAGPMKLIWQMANNGSNAEVISMARKMAANIKEKSKGEVEMSIETFSEDVKNRHRTAFDLVREGKVDFSEIDSSVLVGLSSSAALFKIPYFFRNQKHIEKALAGKFGEQIKKDVESGSNGRIKVIALAAAPGPVLYGRKSLTTAQDLKGSKIPKNTDPAGMDGPQSKFWKALGVEFTGEEISSRADFVKAHISESIDFEENSLVRLMSQAKQSTELLKHVKFVTELNHFFYVHATLYNTGKFEKMTAPQRALVEKEIKEFLKKEVAMADQQQKEAKQYLEAAGVKVQKIDKASVKTLQEAGKTVRGEFSQLKKSFEEIEKLK